MLCSRCCVVMAAVAAQLVTGQDAQTPNGYQVTASPGEPLVTGHADVITWHSNPDSGSQSTTCERG